MRFCSAAFMSSSVLRFRSYPLSLAHKPRAPPPGGRGRTRKGTRDPGAPPPRGPARPPRSRRRPGPFVSGRTRTRTRGTRALARPLGRCRFRGGCKAPKSREHGHRPTVLAQAPDGPLRAQLVRPLQPHALPRSEPHDQELVFQRSVDAHCDAPWSFSSPFYCRLHRQFPPSQFKRWCCAHDRTRPCGCEYVHSMPKSTPAMPAARAASSAR